MDGISTYNAFLAVHKPQLVLSGVPEHYWHTLSKKLQDQIFDSGLAFQLVQIDYEDIEKKPYEPLWSVLAIRDINHNDPNHIYLIDHAWTFKANNFKTTLRGVPSLLERMCNLMQISCEDTEEQIEEVSKLLWKYANTYSIAGDEFSVEERVPLWYVMDELGSGITHSDNPNFRVVPFIHVPSQITFTILFPTKDVEEGDTVTRNFVEGQFPDPVQRDAMLIPWKHYEHFDDVFRYEEPNRKYFLEGHLIETLPDLNILENRSLPNKPLKVFSEYNIINQHLRSSDFEIVNNEDDADILWYTSHFKAYQELSANFPNKFVNQFPFEYILTVKDLLTVIAKRSANKDNLAKLESSPSWFPATFNMKTELPQLVACYMQRKRLGLDNHWICKPYNLARGLDTYITDNLDFLCCLPSTGPKIAQKYIENPVLFQRPDIGSVKFDVRYVILLKSVDPTEVYIYNNFFLRFANKAFELSDFDDYEKHFTVMNYAEGVPLFRLLCDDFKRQWSEQYTDYPWSKVEKSIFNMLKDLFGAATSKPPPFGIAKNPQSRALYAADIMLSWHDNHGEKVMKPKLLEVNWMPDCQRACDYYPQFYNDIFSLLFLDSKVDTCTQIM